ncbi:hypothetical protein [Methylovulum psychrotolerans]|uniref:Uncharacterized protein n=1 Tax=Methylovulum psychrotolerans TaxID=1704499 RepID=A0A2S5CNL7_9GAMM|nr:hypothetical protein [Methylovulum psychrotolerans]POZ52384.1 hypothetical protein AADEFJLK_01866 [Methylovulum psychrotolerans]
MTQGDGLSDSVMVSGDALVASSGQDDSLDYSGDAASKNPVVTPQFGDFYDPRPQEDGARRIIAYLLIGLLWFVVGGMFVLLAFGSIKVIDIKEFAVVLGPIVTLVSAATGFYYGTKSTVPSNNA